MRGLTEPGSRIWLSRHDAATRKYAHALELVEAEGTVVGVNTALPNRLAEEAILAGLVPPLADFAALAQQTFDLVIKASSLSPEFNAKHFTARCSAMK